MFVFVRFNVLLSKPVIVAVHDLNITDQSLHL